MQKVSTADFFMVTLTVSQKGLCTASLEGLLCSAPQRELHAAPLWGTVCSTLRGVTHSAHSPLTGTVCSTFTEASFKGAVCSPSVPLERSSVALVDSFEGLQVTHLEILSPCSPLRSAACIPQPMCLNE